MSYRICKQKIQRPADFPAASGLPGGQCPCFAPLFRALHLPSFPTWVRSWKHLFFGLLAWLVASGCENASQQDSTSRTPQADSTLTPVLRVGIPVNPTELDPRLSSDAWSEKISQLIFRSLYRRGPSGRLEPDLVADLQQPDDHTWHLTLKPEVRFHNGRLLTSQDVRATLEYIQDPTHASIRRESLADLERIETPDPQTLVLHLRAPSAPFLEALTVGIVSAQDCAQSPAELRKHLTGTGPFRFVRHLRDQEVVLERVAPVSRASGLAQRLHFKIIPDPTVRLLELLQGGVDLVQNDVPPALVRAMAERPGIRLLTQAGVQVRYLAFNPQDPILADARVRKAIALGLDREAIVNARFGALATLAGGLLPPASFAYDAALEPMPYDPVRARALLTEAGWPERPDGQPRFRLVQKTSQDEVGQSLARIYQDQARALGIAWSIQPSEWGAFYRDIQAGSFQIYGLTAVGFNDPDYLSFLLHSQRQPPNGGNRVRLRDPELDRLLDLARRLLPPELRRPLYQEAQRRALDTGVYLPLWYERNVALMQASLEGYFLTPAGDLQGLLQARKQAPRAR